MPRIPGSFNGGVPPNIVWDPLNPPHRNGCNGMVGIHARECNGTCEPGGVCSELEVDLMNEHREWERIGMRTENVARDLFKMGVQIQAIINVLRTLVPEGTLEAEFQECLLREMQEIRGAAGEMVKRARLGLAPKGLLGPDGKPMG